MVAEYVLIVPLKTPSTYTLNEPRLDALVATMPIDLAAVAVNVALAPAVEE